MTIENSKCSAIVAGVVFALTTLAGNAYSASLRGDVTVYSNVVLADDLFDDIEEGGDTPLFLAPDLGKSGKISARRIAEEAHDAGIFDFSLNGIKTVTVRRPSIKISANDAERALKDALSERMGEKIDFEINTTSIPKYVHTDPRATKQLAVNNLEVTDGGNRFTAILGYATHQGLRDVPLRGVITEMTTTLTLASDIARDEVITAGDLNESRLPKAKLKAGALSAAKLIVGKAAIRNLHEGAVIREQDIAEPLLIRANDPVSITYSVPGLILTAQGRSLDNGAKGDVIAIRNLQSNRVIRGEVTDPGEVLIVPRSPAFASNQQTTPNEVQ